MKNVQSWLAAFLAVLITVSPVSAQLKGSQAPVGQPSGPLSIYKAMEVPSINVSNSGRLDALMRAGNIYLSLQDAIALALENNLDIEIQRYGPLIAQAELLRAKAGSVARSVSTSVTQGASSATGSSSGGSTSSALATGSATGTGNTGTSGSNASSFSVGSSGTAPPSLDPSFSGTVSWGHLTSPQVNPFLVGTTALVTQNSVYNFQVSQGFLTGGTASLGLSNRTAQTNSGRYDFNPSTSSALSLSLNQPLLQGFGRALNSRFIIIAKNNIQVSDLVFKQQLITTISSIVNLYWDLVSYHEDVRVKQQALALAEKLYNDNKKQVEIGTLAPIEVVRAEAQVASSQQDLTISETNVLEQETIIKNALSRTGMANPAVAAAHIITTDSIRVPDMEAIQPVQDQMDLALRSRPEVEQNRLAITNSQINLKASKNSLLPSLNAFATLTNNALAGQINTLPVPGGTGLRDPSAVDGFFIGGYGTALGQIFRRNFPDYSVGVQLNIPLRNRAAQADVYSSELGLRQQQLNQQRLINQIRVEVQNALIGVQQARARYQAAVKNRVLAEQTFDAEQKKYQLGASTIYQVIQTQRDLTAAQSAEVTALSNYSRTRVELDRSTGQTLGVSNVDIGEAARGVVARPPAALPTLPGASGK